MNDETLLREFARPLEPAVVTRGTGVTPAVALVNPKGVRNVAMALRACAVFGIEQLWVSGERALSQASTMRRLPREERIRSYHNLQLIWGDRFWDAFPAGVTPVAVEVNPGAQNLTFFEHPERALYVFGPEDGGLGSMELGLCHQVVMIPSDGCLNLATAVTLVVGHRRMQRQLRGLEEIRPSVEQMRDGRGWCEDGRF